jgi:hypothetical protein
MLKKLLLGCGIATGAVVVLLIVFGVLSYTWFKNQVPNMKEVEEARKELLERYGEREAYIPDLEGRIQPERLDLFMAVRESLITTRSEIGSRLEGFIGRAQGESWEGRGFFQKIIEGMSMAKGGIGLFREATDYMGIRAEHLLDAEMGEGEYTYLFCLMAYSWMEWDPARSLDEEWFEAHDMMDALDEFRSQHRRVFMKQLRNQRRDLEDLAERSEAQEQALERVNRALDEVRGDDFPYQGDFPEEWASWLEPYRQRFEATLPRAPGEYILESVEQLIDDEESEGFHIRFDN